MITMITCPNCGYDHIMTDDHKMMEQFTMTCCEHTCRIVFAVDLEIVAHTRREPNPSDQRADQEVSHGK